MGFVQTHWLWLPTDVLEVMVTNGRVYDENKVDLGSVDDMKSKDDRLMRIEEQL